MIASGEAKAQKINQILGQTFDQRLRQILGQILSCGYKFWVWIYKTLAKI